MPNAIIDYNLGANSISNPDGSQPAQVTNCIEVPGPGATPLGNYPKAGAGLNYIDLLHGEVVAEVEIKIESKIRNQLLRHIYTGPSEGGSRIFLSNAMNGEAIKTASMSNIGGSSTKPVFLKKQ